MVNLVCTAIGQLPPQKLMDQLLSQNTVPLSPAYTHFFDISNESALFLFFMTENTIDLTIEQKSSIRHTAKGSVSKIKYQSQ